MLRLFIILSILIFDSSLLEAQDYVASKNLPIMNKKTVKVSNVRELESRLANISDNTTVLIAPGVYKISALIYISGKKNIEIRGEKFNRNLVKIVGKGYKNKNYGEARHCFEFASCTNVSVSNISIGDVWFHPIAMQGDCTDMFFYNIRFFDAGEQFLKGNSNSASGRGVLRGKVQYCLFEYTTQARSWYTQGIDIHTAKDWLIKHNIFNNIMGPVNDQLAGHAILLWNGSENTLCESNLILNCARGIAFGLNESKPKAKGKQYDHQGGIIKKNLFIRDPGIRGHDGIIVNNSPNTKILNNVVLANGYQSPIEYRFKNSRNILISGNQVDGKIIKRDGASGQEKDNKTLAKKNPLYLSLRKKAERSLKNAQKFISKGGGYVYFKSIAKKVFAKKSLGLSLKTIRKKLNSEKEAEKKEAVELFTFIEQEFNNSMKETKILLKKDPIRAALAYDKISKQFLGDSFSIQAKKCSIKVKSKSNYKQEKLAFGMIKRIEAIIKRLKPYKGINDWKNSGFKKINASTIKSILRNIDLMVKKYPDSCYKETCLGWKSNLIHK